MKILTFCAALVLLNACTSNSTNESKNNLDKASKPTSNKIPKEIIGKFFTPHAAMQNIIFNAEGTFLFNNSDEKGNDLIEKGTFSVQDTLVTLHKSDNQTEVFTFKKGMQGDENFYLSNETNYMVKK